MQPNFAIHFSEEQAHVLHLSRNGSWDIIGKAPTTGDKADGDCPDAVALRQRMARLGGWSVSTKLVIPNSFIWYTTCLVDGEFEGEIGNEVGEHLGATTPFRIEELAFDWYADGDRARIAYVLKQNLTEAEAFATNWKFNPVCFEAEPPPNSVFQRQAFFGLTKFAIRCGFSGSDVSSRFPRVNNVEPGLPEVRAGIRNRLEATRTMWRRWLKLPVVALLAVFLMPAVDSKSANGNSQPKVHEIAMVPALAGGNSNILRFAQATYVFELEQRPARRPNDGAGTSINSNERATDDGPLTPDNSGADTAATQPGNATSTGDVEADPARVFANRGFNPYALNNDVLEKFQVGFQDTVQADMIARIRQTVVQIEGFDAIGLSEQPDAMSELPEAQPENRRRFSGSSMAAIRDGLTKILTGNSGVEPGTSPAVAETSPLPAPISDSDSRVVEAPSATDEKTVETANAVVEPEKQAEFEVPFQRPARRTMTIVAAQEPTRQPDARIARATPPTQRPAPSSPDGRGIVVSQANETILIDDQNISLIGIYGPSTKRRALVRLESGGFASLYIGADFKGGRVVEISSSAVIYEVSNKRYQLTLP